MWLAEEEVLDFEQRLCFVKREEKAQQHNIAPYLATMQEYRRALTFMCELHALDHPDFSKPTCVLVIGKVSDGLSMSWATPFMLIQIKSYEGWPEVLEAMCEWGARVPLSV